MWSWYFPLETEFTEELVTLTNNLYPHISAVIPSPLFSKHKIQQIGQEWGSEPSVPCEMKGRRAAVLSGGGHGASGPGRGGGDT